VVDSIPLGESARSPSILRPISDVPVESEENAGVPSQNEVPRLVALAKAGDREAFGDLYRLYHAPIYRVVRAQLGDGADDAVAETFVRAWGSLHRYRVTGVPFVGWLYGIARNVVRDEFRRRRRVEPTDRVPDEMIESAMDDDLSLAAAIARLPAEQRKVVELKFLVGLTNAEIASILGITPGAVNSKQWRALDRLRRALEER
jgi:RNA polymerase sigma-70 factor, ECF subfamily